MRPRRFPVVLFLETVVVGGLAGCGGSDPVAPQDPEDLIFHPSLGVDLDQMTRTDAGLYYTVREEGTGEEVVELGDSVTFDYAGWFHDGTLFADSTPPQSNHNPYNYLVGTTTGPNGAILGIDQGVRGMRLDETRLLVIPWELGYGPEGSLNGDIPAYAVLVFEITILEILKQ
jgi:FKBP-type peptidyl-prolyl cis-trans isomerase FkpA